MAAAFDPYHKWLGIPAYQQPPNCYRLLGIRDFEDDPEVIQAAADQRTTHLRSFQSGPYADLAARLLSEVQQARNRLLDADDKTEHDAQLRDQQPPIPTRSVSEGSGLNTPTRSASEASLSKSRTWPDGKAPSSVEEFHQCLDASRVMSADDSRRFLTSLPESKRPDTPKNLAIELLKAGKLTRHQAESVLKGKIKYLSFGEYIILEKLGQGGMGQVLKAEHRRMRRTVALKVISGPLMTDTATVRRFQREVYAAARLIHPNIVTAFDANEHEGVHFFVMEYVQGRDLAELVNDEGPLPVAQAVDYVLQAARGLAYAHGKGIVHRDIKPGNLLVDDEGTVKILDMGLARMEIGADDGQELTNTGQVMGTVDYMAPEQAEDTHAVDARADIYSLGCTLYRLLAGQVLYSADTVVKKLLAHRSKPIPFLGTVCRGIPRELEATFQKMVAKRPEDRQPTMAHVVAELESCLRGNALPLSLWERVAEGRVRVLLPGHCLARPNPQLTSPCPTSSPAPAPARENRRLPPSLPEPKKPNPPAPKSRKTSPKATLVGQASCLP